MPLFAIAKTSMQPVRQTRFQSEKHLQRLIEENLDVVFKCRFVATEFMTGAQHAGRIDTLALSEDNNPVIIEYKNVESSDLINQSLFYLSWIHDHKGDFEMAVHKALGPKVEVDWSDVRVICIAPNFKKYDLHAVRMVGANLELWAYRLYENGVLHLDDVFQKSEPESYASGLSSGKNPVMVAAGKKAAATRASGSYTFEQHLDGKPPQVRELALAVDECITAMDPSIEMTPKKLYVAYKTTQNIACLEVQRQRVVLYLKLDPKKVVGIKGITRDVSNIGHYGTGDLEAVVGTLGDLESVKPLIRQAYEQVGG